jgi:hypothetical protein
MVLQWWREAEECGTNGALNSSLWTKRNGSTNPQILSNALSSNTSAGVYPAEFISRRTSSGDQYAGTQVVALHPGTSGGVAAALLLRTPNSSTVGTIAALFWNNINMEIDTWTSSWSSPSVTQRVTAAMNGGSNIAVGTKIEFTVVGNVFTGYYNGVVLVSWNDSTNIVSTTNRYVGYVAQYGTDGSASGVMTHAPFVGGDWRPVDVPTPSSTVNRSNLF